MKKLLANPVFLITMVAVGILVFTVHRPGFWGGFGWGVFLMVFLWGTSMWQDNIHRHTLGRKIEELQRRLAGLTATIPSQEFEELQGRLTELRGYGL